MFGDNSTICSSSMKITKIAQQVKNPLRYSVYVDDEYSFSLHEQQLVELGLRVGKDLSESELYEYKSESQYGKAYERTLRYVLLRPRSEHEVSQYLERTFLYPKPKMYQTKTGERVVKRPVVDVEQVKHMNQRIINQLLKKGYVDDARFAKAWIESRRTTKKMSHKKLRLELKAKGVADDIIATLLQNDTVTDLELLEELVTKKRKLARYQDNQKLLTYLLRQGYAYSDIIHVLEAK